MQVMTLNSSTDTFVPLEVYSQSSSDFLTYTNSEFGYELDYPSTWSKTETGNPGLHVIITSPFESSNDEFTELVITGAESLFIDLDLDAYTELSMQSLETPNFKLLDSSKTTLSDNPAQMIVFSDKNEFGDDFKGLAVWSVVDKAGYFVMFGAEPSKYSEYLPIFEKMLDSYKIDSKLKEELKLELSFEEYTTHVDSVNEMKFQFPTEWNKLDIDSGGIHYIITSPLENYNDGFSENFVIGTEEIPFGILNLDTYSKMSIQNAQSLPNFELIEEGDTTFAGLPGYQILFSQVDPTYNIKIKSLMVWTIKDDKAYFIGLGSEPEKYSAYLPVFEKILSSFEIGQFEQPLKASIPNWIKTNAGWWANDAIDDNAFLQGIQYLIKEGIIQIPETSKPVTGSSQEIPSWIKNNADWWSQGLISDDDFIKGITFMVENGIITV